MRLKLKTKGEEERLRKEESIENSEDSSAGAESRNVEDGEWMIVVESVEVKVGGMTEEKRKTDWKIGKWWHTVLLSFCCG